MIDTNMKTARRAWSDFIAQHNLSQRPDCQAVADLFIADMGRYCELIQGPGGTPLGFMVRGEGFDFTLRAQRVMEAWHMPPAGIAHHAALAAMFEHKRAFLKLEWHYSETTGQSEHLIAFYFRRRPSVKDVLTYLQQGGVQRTILERVAEAAGLLDKNSIHFVAAALRPGRQVRHKLYFSQYITPERFDDVTRRLQAVLAHFDMAPAVQHEWAQHHTGLLSPEQVTTLFVSISFEHDLLVPSVKFDYPEVKPQSCLPLLPPGQRDKAATELEALCHTAGLEKLSYLGLRLHPSGPPGLKYYADLDGSS